MKSSPGVLAIFCCCQGCLFKLFIIIYPWLGLSVFATALLSVVLSNSPGHMFHIFCFRLEKENQNCVIGSVNI